MNDYKIGCKLFLKSPKELDLKLVIPVFQRWIQEKKIKNHLMIDVGDYSHVPHGPGVLLVMHEGNLGLDLKEGKLGLYYYRKQSTGGSLEKNLENIFSLLKKIAQDFVKEKEISKDLLFCEDHCLWIFNDRLNFPNNKESYKKVGAYFNKAKFLKTNIEIAPFNPNCDSRERLQIQMKY